MTRRETLLKLSGITGFPVLLGSCNMDAVRRAESNLGWRMKQPGTGVQFSGLPEVVKVMILATYPATPTQIRVAEQRARKAVSKIAREHMQQKPAHVTSTHAEKPGHGIHSGEATSVAGEGKPGVTAVVTPAEETKVAAAALKQMGTTTIAVDVPGDSRLQGSRAVLLWNTQTQRIVGNNVYDISSPPPKGQVALWKNNTALYVGGQ